MFISASNFSIAPTGASTLDRFFTAPPAAAAATAAPATASAARASSGALDNIEQQQHQHQQQDRGEQLVGGAQRTTSSSGLAPTGGPKRPAAAGRGALGRQSKTARTGSTQRGDLRAFFAAAAATAPAPAPAPAAATQPAQAAAAATATAVTAGSGSAGTSLLGAEAGVQQQSMDSEVLSSSQDLTDVDSDAVCSPHTWPVAAGASCPAVPSDGQATLPGNPEPGTAAVAGASPQHGDPAPRTLPSSAVVIAAAQHSRSGEVHLSSGAVDFLSVGPAPDSSGPATAALTAASLPVTQQGGVQQQQQEQQFGDQQQLQQQPHACHQQQQPQEQQQLCSQRPQHPVSSPGSGWASQQLALADLDPEVMAALPWDIQMEVQQQLRSNRLSTSSRGRASSRQGSTRGGRSSGAGARGRPAGPSIARFLKSSKK